MGLYDRNSNGWDMILEGSNYARSGLAAKSFPVTGLTALEIFAMN